MLELPFCLTRPRAQSWNVSHCGMGKGVGFTLRTRGACRPRLFYRLKDFKSSRPLGLLNQKGTWLASLEGRTGLWAVEKSLCKLWEDLECKSHALAHTPCIRDSPCSGRKGGETQDILLPFEAGLLWKPAAPERRPLAQSCL